MNINLNRYQKEALRAIIDSFQANNKYALLVMPGGSGKTAVTICAILELYRLHAIKKVAYVSTRKEILYQFKHFAEQHMLKEVKIDIYTHDKLVKRIASNEISKTEFDVIVFDESNTGKMFEQIIQYFEAFNIYLSNFNSTPIVRFLESNNLEVTYKLSISEIINDGTLINFQKKLNKQIDYYTKNKIDGNEYESKLKDLLITLKDSNNEFIRIQELILSGEIDLKGILELSYRKKQIKRFEQLLNDDNLFNSEAKLFSGNEFVWQKFFEANPWIFGFGLNYIFNTPLEGKKLEQTISGYSFNENGKRVDALLKTTGMIQTLCFGEIKTHKTKLLKDLKHPYRIDSWSISDDLAGGVAQIHKTIQKSLENLDASIPMYDVDGYKSIKSLYLYKPKSFLIIGSLSEFTNEKGEIHEEKFSSFELFRRSITDIEIITFDELYERANSIINKIWGN